MRRREAEVAAASGVALADAVDRVATALDGVAQVADQAAAGLRYPDKAIELADAVRAAAYAAMSRRAVGR